MIHRAECKNRWCQCERHPERGTHEYSVFRISEQPSDQDIHSGKCAYGKTGSYREEVLAALHHAQCDDILEKLPQGVDTVIGTKGVYLSGGEQQRIAIARVMLKNAPIIILDEATAFADPDNESRVQAAFSRLSEGKTVIMIAHRLSTVTNVDQIFVIQDGQVAECGTVVNCLQKTAFSAVCGKITRLPCNGR